MTADDRQFHGGSSSWSSKFYATRTVAGAAVIPTFSTRSKCCAASEAVDRGLRSRGRHVGRGDDAHVAAAAQCQHGFAVERPFGLDRVRLARGAPARLVERRGVARAAACRCGRRAPPPRCRAGSSLARCSAERAPYSARSSACVGALPRAKSGVASARELGSAGAIVIAVDLLLEQRPARGGAAEYRRDLHVAGQEQRRARRGRARLRARLRCGGSRFRSRVARRRRLRRARETRSRCRRSVAAGSARAARCRRRPSTSAGRRAAASSSCAVARLDEPHGVAAQRENEHRRAPSSCNGTSGTM